MKFEFDHKTGTMQPKKNEEIYFAKSMGGGLIVDDKKHNIKFIIERDERITKLFGSFDKDRLNLYDMRDARIIVDRVRRLFGGDHKYTDFHYFLKGYVMKESVIKSCSDFLGESAWGDMMRRSSGETIRKEDDVTYDMLTDEDCTVDVLYNYVIKHYKLLGDEKIELNSGEDSGNVWYVIHIPITLSGENIKTEVWADNVDKIWSIDFTRDLTEYVDEMNTVVEIDDENINSDNYSRAYTNTDPVLCSEVVDFLDEILGMVPDPALKRIKKK